MFESGPVFADPLVDVWDELVSGWSTEPEGPGTADAPSGVPGAAWGLLASRLTESGRLDLLTARSAQTAWSDAQGASALVVHAGRRRITPTPGDEDAVYAQRSRLHEAGLALNLSTTAVTDRRPDPARGRGRAPP